MSGGLRRREGHALAARLGCGLTLLAVAGFGVLCTGLTSAMLLVGQPWAFVAAVVAATVFTAPYTALVLWLDHNEAEPLPLLAAAFAWGAVGATAVASLGNDLLRGVFLAWSGDEAVAAALTASLAAPVFEEAAKAAALVGLFVLARDEVDNVLDGVVYGAVIGLGFAWFENIVYYVAAAADGPAGLLASTWARGVLQGLGSHATFTALTGVGLGLFRVARRGAARWFAPPLFFLAAMVAHFGWNTFVGLLVPGELLRARTLLVGLPGAVLALQAPFGLVVAGVVGLAWRHEDALVRTWLADEPPDVAPPDEVGLLVPARVRMAEGLRRGWAGGFGAWWWYRQVANAQIALAFLRWHHARDPEVTWPVDEDAEIAAGRARVRAARARLAAVGVTRRA